MKEVILIKNGELALKGQNRSTFEDVLVKNIKNRLRTLGEFSYTKAQSTVIIEPKSDGIDFDAAEEAVSKVFGVAAYARAAALQKNMDVILERTPDYLKNELTASSSFKVEAKRSDKKFPLTSPEISAALGEKLLLAYPHLTVDVKTPDVTVTVEIRDAYAFVRADQKKGAGGLPTGTSGRAALLISGGIDSPVAGYMMAKRGLELIAVHFASPPYTSERAEQKVHELLLKLCAYCGRIRLYVVPFTDVQEQIRDCCDESYTTIVMRRFMMRVAGQIAENEHCAALVTGESAGQVASQTVWAIMCTDKAASLPVFRPVIGMDKEEIITIARKIDTFDTSVLPFEDCCTIFTPRHPRTHPKLPDVVKTEAGLDVEALCAQCVRDAKILTIDSRKGEQP